jgi:hypothetical protein
MHILYILLCFGWCKPTRFIFGAYEKSFGRIDMPRFFFKKKVEEECQSSDVLKQRIKVQECQSSDALGRDRSLSLSWRVSKPFRPCTLHTGRRPFICSSVRNSSLSQWKVGPPGRQGDPAAAGSTFDLHATHKLESGDRQILLCVDHCWCGCFRVSVRLALLAGRTFWLWFWSSTWRGSSLRFLAWVLRPAFKLGWSTPTDFSSPWRLL